MAWKWVPQEIKRSQSPSPWWLSQVFPEVYADLQAGPGLWLASCVFSWHLQPCQHEQWCLSLGSVGWAGGGSGGEAERGAHGVDRGSEISAHFWPGREKVARVSGVGLRQRHAAGLGL